MIGGELVREARKRAAITQRELAERAGTTQSAIARLESGRTRPAFEAVERMLRLCGFALHIQIVPYDDSDLIQARKLSKLSPQQRMDRLKALHREAQEMKVAMAEGQRTQREKTD